MSEREGNGGHRPDEPGPEEPREEEPREEEPREEDPRDVFGGDDELELGDDFLAELDAEIEEAVGAPTEEYEMPDEQAADVEEQEAITAESDAEDAAADDASEQHHRDLVDAEGQPLGEEIPEEEDLEAEEEELEDDEVLRAEDAAVEDDDEAITAERDAVDDYDEAGDERPTIVSGPPSAARAAAAAAAGAYLEVGRPRRRFPLWARFTLASLLIILATGGATASALILGVSDIAGDLGDEIELQGIESQLASVDGGAPQTILIIGSDKRRGDGQGFGLSDTSMLLRLDPERDAIALFSIPRDLEVNIPGYGFAKFNEAFATGGPKRTLETVKQLTGVDVNHLVQVNFVGFAKAVNAIGCVYVDVDRRYYHSNEGLSAAQQYAEIDVRPGYQRLCGYKALEYVRFRHTDNDVVRAARQQDFLRQARARVPTTDLLTRQNELIDIFTEYTSSDIKDAPTMIQVMKSFIAARDQPVREVHFPGSVGARVTVTPSQIEQAVSQFLGIESSGGPRGATAAPEQPTGPPEAPPGEAPGKPKPGRTGPVPATQQKGKKKGAKKKETSKPDASSLGLEGGSFGKKLAYRIRRRDRSMPIFYPTTVIAGSTYDQQPRAYTLQDHSLSKDDTFCYRFTLETPAGDFYGLQGTEWEDAPILDEPHETREMGDREYKLYFDGDRLRMVAWEHEGRAYWISNSLLRTLTADQMVAIARGTKLLPGPKPPKA